MYFVQLCTLKKLVCGDTEFLFGFYANELNLEKVEI